LPAAVDSQSFHGETASAPLCIHAQVSLTFVPDYHTWVPKQDVLLLKDMATKAKNGRYLSVDQFRWDTPVLALARIGKNPVLHWAGMEGKARRYLSVEQFRWAGTLVCSGNLGLVSRGASGAEPTGLQGAVTVG